MPTKAKTNIQYSVVIANHKSTEVINMRVVLAPVLELVAGHARGDFRLTHLGAFIAQLFWQHLASFGNNDENLVLSRAVYVNSPTSLNIN